ncbi:N-acetylmuramoyl-L-alanine amidase domain-containing protein [Clostridium perfringens]|nr:hypothetical protein [Clostridium perfringens]SUY53467.1 N-acetylmuramoyl-L-alanine amidase domain-containing protein [Clostridium perfringens]
MKIAIRGGHNFLSKGACGLIDETTENRKVYKSVIKNLIENNFEVLDVTPGDCDVNTDLKFGVEKANNLMQIYLFLYTLISVMRNLMAL